MPIRSQVRSHGDGAYPENAAGQGDIRDHNRRLRLLAGIHVLAFSLTQHADRCVSTSSYQSDQSFLNCFTLQVALAMTQRGRGIPVPIRLAIPPAPDLLSVPRQKIFTVLRSVGKGAAADIKSRINSVSELRRRSPAQGLGGDWYNFLLQEVESLARTYYHNDTTPSDDPT
jgi:hypothetical protein